MHAGIHTPTWADTPPGRHSPGQTLAPSETAPAADGMHPTGMHSCIRQNNAMFPLLDFEENMALDALFVKPNFKKG